MFPNNDEVSVYAFASGGSFEGFQDVQADEKGVSEVLEASFINLIKDWVWNNVFEKAENKIDLNVNGCNISLDFKLKENEIKYYINYLTNPDDEDDFDYMDEYFETF